MDIAAEDGPRFKDSWLVELPHEIGLVLAILTRERKIYTVQIPYMACASISKSRVIR